MPVLRSMLPLATCVLLAMMLQLTGCATAPMTPAAQQQLANSEELADVRRAEALNQQLLVSAAEQPASSGEYVIGPDDVLNVDIFGVPEMSRSVRVDARGRVSLPLAGQIEVSGLTPGEAEQHLARILDESYLRNPQISITVEEYRSLQFTVVGAVASPRSYTSSRSVTLLEALGMAGGLSNEAGSRVSLTDRVRDVETGEILTRSVIIDLNDLVANPGQGNVVLGLNAIVNVPRAGVVYVEGAVGRPGAVAARSDTTVLGALAMAGGLTYEASPGDLQLHRRTANGNWETLAFNFNVLRDRPDTDVVLSDGDVLVVGYSGIKRAIRNFNTLIPGAVLFLRY